jgi:hypothetical protein
MPLVPCTTAGDGWTADEDSTLIKLVRADHEVGAATTMKDWEDKARVLSTGRSGKACQTRWLRYLAPRQSSDGTVRHRAHKSTVDLGALSSDKKHAADTELYEDPSKRARCTVTSALQFEGAEFAEDSIQVPSLGDRVRHSLSNSRRSSLQKSGQSTTESREPLLPREQIDERVQLAKGSLRSSASVVGELWKNVGPTEQVHMAKRRHIFELDTLQITFQTELTRELMRGPALLKHQARNPTADSVVSSVLSKYAALQSHELQRQSMEVHSLVASSSLLLQST